jgi:hypothetical protein
MRSHVEISFYRQGVQVGSPVLFNQADVHPDITDAVSWDDIVNFGEAIYHGFTGHWYEHGFSSPLIAPTPRTHIFS